MLRTIFNLALIANVALLLSVPLNGCSQAVVTVNRDIQETQRREFESIERLAKMEAERQIVIARETRVENTKRLNAILTFVAVILGSVALAYFGAGLMALASRRPQRQPYKVLPAVPRGQFDNDGRFSSAGWFIAENSDGKQYAQRNMKDGSVQVMNLIEG